MSPAAAWARSTRAARSRARPKHTRNLTTFQAPGEPASVAAGWHQLGRVYQEQRRWEEAEQAYRESARLTEERGDSVGAAESWHQLAQLMQAQNKLDEAEQWYNKAFAHSRAAGNRGGESRTLNSLANLLRSRPGRLADARRHAEQALAIKQTLDPAASQIWTTCRILAEIADAEGRADEARSFRRQGRQSFAAAPASRETLRRWSAVATAASDPAARQQWEQAFDGVGEGGRTRLIASMHRLLEGERDEDALTDGLYQEDSLIVTTALRALADPAVLAGLQGDAPSEDQGEAAMRECSRGTAGSSMPSPPPRCSRSS